MDKQFENMQKLAFGKILIKESIENKKMTKSQIKAKIREIILNEYNSYSQTDELDPEEEFSDIVGRELVDKKESGEITNEEFKDALDYLSSDSNSYSLFHEFGREQAYQATSAILDRMNTLGEAKKKTKDVMPQNPEAKVPEVPTTPSDNMSFDVPQSPTTMASSPGISSEQKDIHNHLMSAYDSALKSGDEKLIIQIRNTIQFLNKTMLDGGQQAVAEGILLEHDMDILNDIEGDLMNSDMSEEERIGYLNDIIDYCRMEKEKILQQLNETNT